MVDLNNPVVQSLFLIFVSMVAVPMFYILIRSYVDWEIRESRRKHGRCLKCGYDLAGLECDICPECGHQFVLVTSTPA